MAPRRGSSRLAWTVAAAIVPAFVAYLVFQSHLFSSLDRSPVEISNEDLEAILSLGRSSWEDAASPWRSFDWQRKGKKRRFPKQLPREDQEMRDLIWGDVQFLHTTDIHGWLAPHHSPASASYSADWADWVSFIDRMKANAQLQGKDLVVVDTGDLITGHGLSDSHPSSPPGTYSNRLFAMADYDVLTVGNHELYSLPGLQELKQSFIPRWQGRYLTSNVNYTTEGNETAPSGNLYTSFRLPQTGLRLTSLGVLFDFKSPHPDKISIQSPLAMLDMAWFEELMESHLAKETDIWLIAGHMPLDGEEDQWSSLIAGMRRWESVAQKPIVGLGGHTHIRNCRQEDPYTMILQSGRFHETAGFLSLSMPTSSHATPSFSRRYIDLNPLNLAHHLGIPLSSSDSLTTPFGHFVRHLLHTLLDRWQLDESYGSAPRDWSLEGYPVEDERSILHGAKGVLRRVFDKRDEDREELNTSSTPQRLVVLNSGSFRADLRQGPFTVNDAYIVSPFSDAFFTLQDVPMDLVLDLLASFNNRDIEVERKEASYNSSEELNSSPSYLSADHVARTGPSPGHVTRDSCGLDGLDGDDTVHSPIPLVPFEPPYLGVLTALSSGNSTTIELITVAYLLPRIVKRLNDLSKQAHQDTEGKTWTVEAATPFLYKGQKLKTRDLWIKEAEEMWN